MNFIGKALLATIHFFLASFGIYDQTVHIGLPDNLQRKDAHGIAVVNLPGGGQRTLYFIADKPSAFENPRAAIVDSLFAQLRKLEYSPVSLELFSEKYTRVYKPEHVRPILMQSRPLAY